MRKLILFLVLLIVGVFTTACVNTYAVKQLNETALEYMKKGDIQTAISRLEASVDLDANIYESRYNLAAAYLRVGECEKAMENIKAAQLLIKKEEPIVFYTIGVADNCLASQLYEKVNEDGTKEPITYDDPVLSTEKAKQYVNYLTEANENFDKYTQLQPNADDTKQVLETIEDNKSKIEEKKSIYGE